MDNRINPNPNSRSIHLPPFNPEIERFENSLRETPHPVAPLSQVDANPQVLALIENHFREIEQGRQALLQDPQTYLQALRGRIQAIGPIREPFMGPEDVTHLHEHPPQMSIHLFDGSIVDHASDEPEQVQESIHVRSIVGSSLFTSPSTPLAPLSSSARDQRSIDEQESTRIINHLRDWARDSNMSPEAQRERAKLCVPLIKWLQSQCFFLNVTLNWKVLHLLPNIFQETFIQDKLTELTIECPKNEDEWVPESGLDLSILRNLKLKELAMWGEGLRKISESSFQGLTSLKILRIFQARIPELPESICELFNLERLVLCENSKLIRLPRSLVQLKKLEILSLNRCRKLLNLPDTSPDPLQSHEPYRFGNLSALESLALIDCKALTRLPDSICKLKNLKHLNLMNCSGLEELPVHMGELTVLKDLWMDGTKIESLPISLYRLALDKPSDFLPPRWQETVDWMRGLYLSTTRLQSAYAVQGNTLRIEIKPETAIPFAEEHLDLLVDNNVFPLARPPSNISVRYVGEGAIDVGGLRRDFFYHLFPNFARQIKDEDDPIFVYNGDKGYYVLETGMSRPSLLLSNVEERFCINTGKLIGSLLFGLGGGECKIGNVFPPHFYAGLLYKAFTPFCELSRKNLIPLCRVLAIHDQQGLADMQGRLLFDMVCLKNDSNHILMDANIPLSDDDLYKIWKLINHYADDQSLVFAALPQFFVDGSEAMNAFPEGMLEGFREKLKAYDIRGIIQEFISHCLFESYKRQCAPIMFVAQGFNSIAKTLPPHTDFEAAVYQRLSDASDAMRLGNLPLDVVLSYVVQGLPFTPAAFRSLIENRSDVANVTGLSSRVEVLKNWYLTEATDEQKKQMLRCMNGTDVITANLRLRFNGPAQDLSVFHTCFGSVDFGGALLRQDISTPEGKAALVATWIKHIEWALPKEGSVGGFQAL